ncbi:MAG: hypothetical protein PHT54_02990, partial [Candidatus Nanoarchaeia archaeon]|nr:hypothetical protein [Candidatus Nanoarchaeia archaeon]
HFNVSAVSQDSVFNMQVITVNEKSVENATNTTFYIDGVAPRLINFNITDGNHTVINTTWDAEDSVLDYAPLTVAVEIDDIWVDSSQVWMYYQTNGSANASYSASTYKGVTRLTQTANTKKFTGTIATSDLVDQNVTSVEFYINDTVGNYDIINNTVQSEKPDAFTVLINSSHKNVLRIGNVNITDGTNTVSFDGGTGATQYIKPDAAVIIEAEISGEAKNSSAWLYITNNSATSGPSYYELMLDMNVTGTFPESNNERVYVYNFTAGQLNFTDTQVVTFMIVAMTNGTNDNEPNYTSEFTASVTVDGTAPVPAITAPSDTSIDVSGSITYTCAAADATSSIASHSWKLVKPDATEITRASTLTGGKETVTWSSTDTNQAGTYGVYCYAKDSVQNEGVSTISQFTATYVTSASSGGGGSGGGSGETTTTFDADLTVSEAATLTAAQGSARTFTFDGSTSHSIKVDKVEGTTVTFTISSTPVTVTMKVGDVKEVDLNGDGLNDIEVNVESIASSIVKYSIKKIEEGATALVEEEEAAAEPVTEEVEPVTEEIGEEASTLWLWIVLVVIIIAAIVYFVIKSKR